MRTRLAPAILGALAGVLIIAGVRLGDISVRQSVTPGFARGEMFEKVAAQARPSVMEVIALTRADEGDEPPEEEDAGWLNGFWDHLKRKIMTAYKVKSIGSGVVIDWRGHIVTNHHVIDGADRVMVKSYATGEERAAEIVGDDPMTDLALLKTRWSHGLVPLPLANISTVRPGQFVAAIGNPFNLENSVTVGVISAMGRSDLGIVDLEDFIQTDAPIYPGNSGGPLVDLHGRVVGVNTAVLGMGYGIGFAIPSSEVRKVTDELIRKGRVERGRIGVWLQKLTPELAESLDAPEASGALVVKVENDSPAADAAIKIGDIITSFGGKQITSPRQLRSLALRSRPGAVAKVKIIRDAKEISMELRIGALEKAS